MAPSTRRALFALALTAPLLLQFGCSDSATEPPPTAEDGFTVVAETAVGPAGGELSADGVVISIPAGALAVETDLELAYDPDAAPPGDAAGSGIYRILGLEAGYAAPLRVALLAGAKEDGASLIAVGATRPTAETETGLSYDFVYHAATDSAGYVVATLPPRPAPDAKAAREGAADPGIQLFHWNGTYQAVSGNFNVYGDHASAAQVAQLASLLEDQYSRVRDEFGLDPDDWFVLQRFNVVLAGGDHAARPPRCFFEPTVVPGDSYVTWAIGEDWLAGHTADELSGRTGRLFIQTYQMLHDGGGEWVRDYWLASHYVVHRAFEFWFEKHFRDDEDFAPDVGTPDYALSAGFLGRRSGHGGLLEDLRARSMLPMVDAMMADPAYGLDGFRQCCAAIGTAGEPWSAFFGTLEASLEAWLPVFYADYLLGHHYGLDFPVEFPLEDVWSPDAADPLYEVDGGDPWLYHDLEAKAFGIDLNFATFSPGARMRFQVTSDVVNDQNLSVAVLAQNGDGLFYLGHGTEWILEGLQSELIETQGVRALYAVVVNGSHALDYQGESGVYLTMELLDGLSFGACDLVFRCEAVEHWVYPDETTADIPYSDYEIGIFFRGEGLIDQTTFTVPIDDVMDWGGDSYVTYQGYYTGTCTEDFAQLTEFYGQWTATGYSGGQPTGWSSTTEILLNGTLQGAGDSTYWAFTVAGTDACEPVASIVESGSGPSGSYTLSAWSCVESSLLEVRLLSH